MLVGIMPRGQTINSYLYIQTLQTWGAFQEELTPKKCCWNSRSIRQRTNTHKNTGRITSFFPTHHTAQILLPLIYNTPFKPSKMPSLGKSVGVTTMLKKWLRVQNSNRYKNVSFSLVLGSWRRWKGGVLNPCSYPTSMFKKNIPYNKLLAIKIVPQNVW